jgi:zinc protease
MLGWMIDEVDSVALANQQDVVRNERRQSFENRPYGIVEEALFQALYPEGHPIARRSSARMPTSRASSWPTSRPSPAPTTAPTTPPSCWPATSTPAGPALVQKYFGTLKAGPKPPEVRGHAADHEGAPPRGHRPHRAQPPEPGLAHAAHVRAGDAELDVAAHVLGGGKASRLYGLLVRDRQLAQSVQVVQDSLSLSSVFNIEVVARPGPRSRRSSARRRRARAPGDHAAHRRRAGPPAPASRRSCCSAWRR